MSMIMHLLRVDQLQLEAFMEDSDLLEDVYYDDEMGEGPAWVYLDKAWDGLLYIMTGRGIAERVTQQELEEPFMQLRATIYNEKMIDEDLEIGYGPATYADVQEVQELHQLLQATSSEDLSDRFDPEAMTRLGVYPTGIWDDDPRGNWEYLLIHFELLKEFYAAAAADNQAVISIIS